MKIDLEKLKLQVKNATKQELREELIRELREDLKAEIKAELAAEGAATGAVQEDEAWAEEEWKWEEPVKPELNFLEFDGYFRFRYDFFNNLDLNTFYVLPGVGNEPSQVSGPFAPGYAPPVPICNTDVGTRQVGTPDSPNFVPGDKSHCANRVGEGSSLGGANMRLRLEPVFNVFEDIKIKMQLDILDNLVLGSTPDGFPNNPISPLLAFSQTQIRPSDGVNALTDSIVVKRAWAEVMTPLGQLRVGRMPSDFGMGLLANGGKGLDSDYGDTNDRIMFATKIGDFYIVPAFDWTVSGPTSAIRFDPYGQPYDRSQRDDVDQYILAVAKRDSAEEMKQKRENDDWILNYGTYHVLRFQALDAATFYNQGEPTRNAAGDLQLVERDAFAWAYSFWGQFEFRKFKVEAEVAGIVGNIGNSVIEGPYGSTDRALSINQHGGSVNMEYKLLKDSLTIRLLVAWATGDSAPGWGVRPLLDVSDNPNKWDGTQAPPGDTNITNFRFDPDFIVDMIFWRQLVGTVTDALIIRPGVQYNLTEGFGARLDAVYSRAWFAQSTPSSSFGAFGDEGATLGSPDSNLGLEFDLKLFFNSEDGFHAWAQYGLFIPFGGLDRVTEIDQATADQLGGTNVTTDANGTRILGKLNASLAHTIQFLIGVTF